MEIESLTVILTGGFNHRNSSTKDVIKSFISNPKVKRLIISCKKEDVKNYERIKNEKIKIISVSNLELPSYLPKIYRSINNQANQILQGLIQVETDYLIRVRSDIEIRNLDYILNSIKINKSKIGLYPGTPDLIDGAGSIFSICDFVFIGKRDLIYNICKLNLTKKITLENGLISIIFSLISKSGWTPQYVCKIGKGFHPEQIIFRSYLLNRYGKKINSAIDDLSYQNIKYYENIIHNDFYACPPFCFRPSKYLERYGFSNYLSENEIKLYKSKRYIFRYLLILLRSIIRSFSTLKFFKKFIFLFYFYFKKAFHKIDIADWPS